MSPKVAPSLSLSFIFLFLILLPLFSHADHEVHHAKKKAPPSQRVILLKDLQGAHKELKLQGLHQLKKYLHKFGYLTSSPATNDNDFDDTLELALKKYQQNFHLKATGSLDAETISMMTMPRCGVPDIINGTTSMQTGNKSHYHSPNTFTAVSLFTFISGYKWNTMPVTYGFVTSMDSSFQNAIKRAMLTWVAATNNQLSFQEVASNELISIGFFSGDHGDDHPFDGPVATGGNVLAHGFSPDSGGDLHFDATENWSTSDLTPNGFIDVESVALHELGHTLGLGHSNTPGAIMGPTYFGGKATTLSSDDINGIRALYGP